MKKRKKAVSSPPFFEIYVFKPLFPVKKRFSALNFQIQYPPNKRNVAFLHHRAQIAHQYLKSPQLYP